MSADENVNDRLDPDPFTFASLGLSAVGVMLSFVQAYKALRPSEPVMKPGHRPIQHQQLTALEQAVDALKNEMRQVARVVERNAKDPDKEFYDAPVRIGVTMLMLPPEGLDQFAGNLATTAQQIATLARWTATIQNSNPDLAYRLGARMETPLADVADQLNAAMATGAPIRAVLAELRLTLESLSAAIEAEFPPRPN